MKKKPQCDYCPRQWLKKMYRLMKLSAIGLFIGLTTLHAESFSQVRKVSLEITDYSLLQLLDLLQEKSGYTFLFSSEDVRGINGISLKVRDKDALDILGKCLEGTGIGFDTDGELIILKKNGFQQQKEQVVIKGTVRSEKGESLPGVTILLKGTQLGGVTDVEGKFTLELPRLSETILVFTFVGMQAREIPWNGEESLNVVMKEELKEMEEVVVTGFFSRNRSTYTGAARSMTSEQLLAVSPTNVFQALTVLEPGLQVLTDNNEGSNPNYIPELIIRGTNSLATSNEYGLNLPLIVLDGVESDLSKLYDIDIYDVERIDVLKDASATALYGERAANGVIVITRKRVTESPLRLRFSFTPSFEFADLSGYDLCNAEQKLELENLAGLYKKDDGSMDEEYNRKYQLIRRGVNTDWISKPLRNSASYDASLSLTGRGSGLEYNVTARYRTNKGVMKEDYRRNFDAGVFLSYRTKNKLTITLRGDFGQMNSAPSPYGSFYQWVVVNPYDAPEDEFGRLSKTLSWDMENPLYEANLTSFTKSQERTMNATLDLRWDILPDLFVTAQGAMVTLRGTKDVFVSPDSYTFKDETDLLKKGSYTLYNNSQDKYSGKLVLNYRKALGEGGSMITLNAGGDINKSTSDERSAVGVGFLNERLNDFSFASAYPEGKSPLGEENVSTSAGAFAAANFTLLNRYFVDGSYRISGSSKFGADKKFAPFWSVGLGWNLHREKFASSLEWINTFRVKGSYGHTGSVNFPAYQAITTYRYSSSNLYTTGIGAVPITMGNENLKWQTTKKLNAGLVSTFLNDRLNINFDVYKEVTEDMLIAVSMPPSSGVKDVKDNFGSQKNIGYEFSVWGKVIDRKGFAWNLTLNGMHVKSRILNISEALRRQNDEQAGITNEAAPRILFEEGGSATAIYAVRSAGIDPASGQEIFITKEGKYTYIYNPADKVRVGDTNPKLRGSLSTGWTYKNISLNIYFQYTVGGDTYNITREQRVENINPKYNADIRAFTERWKEPGNVSPYLSIAEDGGSVFQHSDRFVERLNELWLSSVTLNYEFTPALLHKIGFNRMRVGMGCNDLFRLSTVKYERGLSYPFSRGFNMSLSFTL